MPNEESKAKSADGAAPSEAAVRGHLKQVLQHPDFAASPQLSSFLTYVVERKLEGAEERIKAYSIATEALGRPASFDPQADPIVRVQARRLRQTLLAYYNAPGADRAMRIELTVGKLHPAFSAAGKRCSSGPGCAGCARRRRIAKNLAGSDASPLPGRSVAVDEPECHQGRT